MDDSVDCIAHGRRPATLVCQHVAGSLLTRQPAGFFWSADDSRDFPDAWCTDCNERHVRCGMRWEGEALDNLGARVICSGCYMEARRMALGR